MKRMEYIERRENLEAEIKNLRRKEEELDKMQSECKHEIVIVLDEHNCYSIEAKCLFCGRMFYDPRALREVGKTINMNTYQAPILFLRPDEKYQIVRKMFEKLDSENLEISQIANIIKEELKKEHEELISIYQGLINP